MNSQTPLFLATFVGVVEEMWFETGYGDSAVVDSKKNYFLNSVLFTAKDSEAAYEWAIDFAKRDSDCNHDGEGHQTRFYVLGIHQVERLSDSLEVLNREVADANGFELSHVPMHDIGSDGVPKVRAKGELDIFQRR